MSLLLVGIGVLLLAVPAAVVRSRVGPELRVRAASAAIVAGLFAVLVGLALAASPLLLVVQSGHDIGEQQAVIEHVAPAGPAVWLTAAVVALGATWLLGRSLVRSRRIGASARIPTWARPELTREVHGCDVIVADRRETAAFAVPGRDPQIVISQGLLNRLSPAEVHAVTCHEVAHIHLGHHRYLAIFNAYAELWGSLPGAGSVAPSLRRAVEEWADQEALHAFGAESSALSGALESLGSLRILPPGDGPLPRCARRDGAMIGFAIVALVGAATFVTSHSFEEVAQVAAALH